jgi:NADH dehydrogenase
MDEFIHNTLTDYYKSSISCDDISITLVNQGSELLSAFPPVLRKKALEILQDKKINVLLNTGVKEVLTNSVLLSDGKNIDSTHTIWTAGVKPNTEIFNGVLDMNKGGRIFVDKNLHIPAFPEIFVIGDVSFVKEDENSAPLPMTAQVAVRQGDHVASNVKAFLDGSELIRFEFESKGEMASLGRFQGLANIFGFSITGPVAWFLWRTVYLFKFISHFKKIKVAFDWTMNLFFSRDITKI